MLIGGFQKNTFIDFPGEIASLVFTKGCNFRCPYCHNPDLVYLNEKELSLLSEQISTSKKPSSLIKESISPPKEPSSLIKEHILPSKELSSLIKENISPTKEPSSLINGHLSPSILNSSPLLSFFQFSGISSATETMPGNLSVGELDVFNFIEKRKGMIDGVAITGGEPTLQKDLESFCYKMKSMGLKVKLDTNGSRPWVLKRLLCRDLLDFVAMDVKSDLSGYRQIAGDDFDTGLIRESIRLIISKAPDHEFRTTCVKPFVTEDSMKEILSLIDGASRYILQHCSDNVVVLEPDFFRHGGRLCSEDEMNIFRKMAEHRGFHCTIR
ncbi:hypothetical protein MTBBW1_1310019 [Desulfamplus magnetovallimortis]|uniref:Radical SAM core domain-containing protein n=1 Tax=Desulfamplus magnetovallimortis TaxID=1246637 RepID=A0A1W1H769_9BACT|nr:anaerobic ribonucleoside-triphosphate reductase activating protein [Desulfamplus magnetovallimortis]SLM28321.1 hypothetical protein MTBBW1_1310019 [Desulfamplus magnetovallimortis]